MTQESVRRASITVSLVAVFAALYIVLSILPGIPVVGLGELKIELEASIASVFGIVLGPYLGALPLLSEQSRRSFMVEQAHLTYPSFLTPLLTRLL